MGLFRCMIVVAGLMVAACGAGMQPATACDEAARAMFPDTLREGPAEPDPLSFACEERHRPDAVLPTVIVAAYSTANGECIRLLEPTGDDTWRVASEFWPMRTNCGNVTFLKTRSLGPEVEDGVAVEFCGPLNDIWLFDIGQGILKNVCSPSAEEERYLSRSQQSASLVDLADDSSLQLIPWDSLAHGCAGCRDVYTLQQGTYTYSKTLRWYGTYNANMDGTSRNYNDQLDSLRPDSQYILRIMNGPTFHEVGAAEFQVKWNGEEIATRRAFAGSATNVRSFPVTATEANALEVTVAGGSIAVACELMGGGGEVQAVMPTVDCATVTRNIFSAWIGYDNPNDRDVYIPVGERNHFGPVGSNSESVGQPEVLLAGRHDGVKEIVELVEGEAERTWYLDGNVLRIIPDELSPCVADEDP